MAVCDSSELMAEACASGFSCLSGDSRLSWAVAVQQLYNLSGETATAQELLDQACVSGFTCRSDHEGLGIAAQQLCNLTDSPVQACTNLIPDGAMYDEFGLYSILVNEGGNYQVSFGDNEVNMFNDVESIDNPGNSEPIPFTAATYFVDFISTAPSIPVTASLCIL